MDIQETKPGSQGVCFALLDVGLSQLMPNTRQLVRFLPHGKQIKQPFLLKSVTFSTVGEEIEHFDAHCFTTLQNSVKSVKQQGCFVPFGSKLIPFKTLALFAVNLTFWMHSGSFPTKSSISH